jgi:hypothetical protein
MMGGILSERYLTSMFGPHRGMLIQAYNQNGAAIVDGHDIVLGKLTTGSSTPRSSAKRLESEE